MNKNLKPYATTKRRKFFDWNAFLAQDIIKHADWVKAKTRADSWVTCACGNQCAVIPRDFDGEPLDIELRKLGLHFSYAIDDRATNLARITLAKIEVRSAYLLTLPDYCEQIQ